MLLFIDFRQIVMYVMKTFVDSVSKASNQKISGFPAGIRLKFLGRIPWETAEGNSIEFSERITAGMTTEFLNITSSF